MAEGAEPAPVHRYAASVTWQGSTGLGYEGYDRTHRATTPPVDDPLDLSADPAFGGRPELRNPEQLVVLAAASCQLLSFLAVAARARIDVVAYHDGATATMDEANRPTRIDEIVLRPRIDVVEGPTEERIRRLVQVAHRECFIARSLATPVVVEPVIRFVATDEGGDPPDAGRDLTRS